VAGFGAPNDSFRAFMAGSMTKKLIWLKIS
jgi:hypothetical protein